MDQRLVRLRGRFDRVGVLLSCLCAVHCVAGLVLLAGLGIGGSLLLDPAIHKVGLVIATIVAAAAIGMGALRHRRRLPVTIAIVGLCFMSGALAAGHGVGEMVLTILGVTLVATGHFLNLREA